MGTTPWRIWPDDHGQIVEFPWSPELLSWIKYHSNEILWIHKSRVTIEEWSVANGGFHVVETNVDINLMEENS